jgi:hypothetical protein
MVGNMVHILLRQDLKKGGMAIISLHESYESVTEKADLEADYYEERGYVVERCCCHSFIVKAVDRPLWHYFISSRTIDK